MIKAVGGKYSTNDEYMFSSELKKPAMLASISGRGEKSNSVYAFCCACSLSVTTETPFTLRISKKTTAPVVSHVRSG